MARTAERLVVFVDGALPGESVRARIGRIRAGYAEASTLEVVRPSPNRIEPRCEHYGECGGCDLQHLRPEAQRTAKRAQVAAILSRIAGLHDPPVREMVAEGEPWGYRFRIDFDWTVAGAGRPALGLHRRGEAAAIVPIRHCDLITATAGQIAAFLAAEAGKRHLTPWDRRTRTGFLRRASLQEARGTREILVSLETGRGEPQALPDLAQALTRSFPRVVGVVRREIDKGGDLVEESILCGRDHLFEEIDSDRFKVPAGAFFQPNAPAGAALRRVAIAAVDSSSSQSILELYCGVGFMTLALARRAAAVVAVEGSREAIAAARENTARAGRAELRFVRAEVSAALPDLLASNPWDALLLDPPRAGLPRGCALAIASARISRVVYVSCDPATLARDLKILIEDGGFRLEEVTPVDLFPQTHHIECVARLSRCREEAVIPSSVPPA